MAFPAKTEAGAIAGAALELVERQGWQALTMRAIAASLGVRASSLYRHYPDRAALETALGNLAAKSLLQAMQSVAGKTNAIARLNAVANAYVKFGGENRALYDLIAVSSKSTEIPAFVGDAIARCIPGSRNHVAAATVLHSLLHGSVSLNPGGPKAALEKGLAAIVKGFA